MGLPPVPEGPSAIGGALGGVAKALPVINGVLGAIQAIDKVWDMIKPNTGTSANGPSASLGAAMSTHNQTDLDRVVQHHVAEKLLKKLMKVGLENGVDFTKWKNGMPPADLAPPAAPAAPTGPKAPAAPAGHHAPAPPPAHATPPPAPAAPTAPTAPAAPPRTPGSDIATLLIGEIQRTGIDDLKKSATQEIRDKIAGTKKTIHVPQWWWNGDNEKGRGDPDISERGNAALRIVGGMPGHDRDHDHRTVAKVRVHLDLAYMPDGQLAGMPDEAKYFGDFEPAKQPAQLGWFIGGQVTSSVHEASGDNLGISLLAPEFHEGINPFVGGYKLAIEFQWDRSKTRMDCDVVAQPKEGTADMTNFDYSGGDPEPLT